MSISIIEVGSRFGTWYDRRASAHRERVVPHLDDATVRARLFLWGAGNVISARAASGGVRPNRPSPTSFPEPSTRHIRLCARTLSSCTTTSAHDALLPPVQGSQLLCAQQTPRGQPAISQPLAPLNTWHMYRSTTSAERRAYAMRTWVLGSWPTRKCCQPTHHTCALPADPCGNCRIAL